MIRWLRKTIQWLKTQRYALPIFMATVSSFTLAILFVEATHRLDLTGGINRVIFYAVFALCYVGPIVVIRSSTLHTFRKESPQTLLKTIILSYFSIIVSFAGLYYAAAALGDLLDAHDAYDFYHEQVVALDAGDIDAIHPRVGDTRAFRGVTARLWGGPEENYSGGLPPGLIEPPPDWVVAAVRRPESEVILFEGGNRLDVLISCTHLSVATMTTLGYGDIAPNRPLTQLATDLQVISSVVLTALGLGLLFAGWWAKDPEDEQEPGHDEGSGTSGAGDKD